jgi:transcriptional regulator with XRE-family HTH domain
MTLESLKAKLLSNPKTKKYYQELKMEFHIATEIIKLRTKFGLTQRQLAEKTGIKQPQIARIESGTQQVKLETLERIAESLGYSVEIKLVPKIDDELIDRTLDAVIEENERKQTAEEYEEEQDNFEKNWRRSINCSELDIDPNEEGNIDFCYYLAIKEKD